MAFRQYKVTYTGVYTMTAFPQDQLVNNIQRQEPIAYMPSTINELCIIITVFSKKSQAMIQKCLM